jgi:hypothetical protein
MELARKACSTSAAWIAVGAFPSTVWIFTGSAGENLAIRLMSVLPLLFRLHVGFRELMIAIFEMLK